MNMKRLIILPAVLVVISVAAIIAFYSNWLWFNNMAFASVFWVYA